MSYATEKKKVERKIKRLKRILWAVVLSFVLMLVILSAFYPAATWKYHFRLPEFDMRGEGELRIHYVDVGQGDATLIELPDNKIMLIDGGTDEEGSKLALLRYITALKIKSIDYLLVTHADGDHCGGLKTLVEYIDVKRAFLPVCDLTANQKYADFYAALMKRQCPWEYSTKGVDLSVSGDYGYTLQFLYPYSLSAEEQTTDDNLFSAVVWLDYKGVSALFTGDAPKRVEERLVQDDKLHLLADAVSLSSTEILKVSHHGSGDATSEEFVEYLNVEHAMISCGKDNAYGHPASTVCENLAAVGAEIHRSDVHGSVIATIAIDGTYAVERLGK